VQPLLRWKSNTYCIFWMCVFSLMYAACNGHAPYCHRWPVPFCHIFPLSHTRQYFQKQVTEYKMCVFIVSTTFVWNISHYTKKWVRYDKKMYKGLDLKHPLFLSEFNETWIFSTDLRKILNYQNLMKIRPVGAELLHADERTGRQTDMTKLNSHFSQFRDRA
jgi:hypothetical protein